MTPVRVLILDVALWIIGPTRAPWSRVNDREGLILLGSATALTATYRAIVGSQQLYFEPVDANLVLLLDTLLIPIVLSAMLSLLGRSASVGAVCRTLSWLYRAWTLQVLLLWFWALALKQVSILSAAQGPVVSNFSVALLSTGMVVAALTAVSMRRGDEGWQNILSALAVYGVATFASWELRIPAVGLMAWWAPDIE